MINIKKIGITSAIFWILMTGVLSGCSQNTGTETATSDNTNQTVTTSLNNDNISALPSNTSNTMTPNGSDTATTSPNGSMPEAGNDSVQTADKQNPTDRKPTQPVKSPTPIQSTGAQDMFLFVQIRGALNADKELGDAVTVELKEGNVILTGKVPSEEQKKKAEEAVRNVKGIKSIKNNLRVSS
jgi:hypothetical protein